ncbi:acyl-coenzyme A amino acid N-acyltransferase 1 isoform X2 [Lingula anatina]|uniref:Acyl-coenzyme A amino acid N-acyltransferase 1 isoform X1 n=1 Tax=Lingula anatina TaxID=7574 RepID=A0A1S3J2V4_LINAN|nr:acyl-coenzyme A amino acid N-acyltransferase 1 isoform X1 [Lingula anatina]XP_013404573.1 acyl-coenzyme A amino acid N-acyltransferase 1 isoform X2 [Lingula anatina]|eukprot:XP_013404572.1 acyl-coenzyme A amino acid N-acyltransferase 1 isoform X1 [Lingula anatina]
MLGKRYNLPNSLCTYFTPKAFLSTSKHMMNGVKMQAMPGRVMMDEKVELQIKGLTSSATVTVKSFLEERGMKFGAYAHFIANSNGEVNTATSPSLGGSYTGTDVMGLYWSMVPVPGQRDGLRLMKKDVTTPYNVHISLLSGHIDPYSPNNNVQVPVAEANIERLYMADNVERIPVREGALRGALFVPKGQGSYPGVIDLFGAAGGLIEHRASLLASRGFVVLALAYFGYEDLPKKFMDVNLTYFGEAAEWLSHHPSVTPGGIGVIGTSKGAQIALISAIHFPQVKAVVTVSGLAFVDFMEMKIGDKILPAANGDLANVSMCDGGICFKTCFPEEIEEEYMIKVEQINAPLLLFFGADEPSFDAPQSAKMISERLHSCGHKDYEIHVYDGAGHLIEPPYAPHCKTSYHKVLGTIIAWGGDAQAHIKAEVHHWKRTLEFFRKHLSAPVPSKL